MYGDPAVRYYGSTEPSRSPGGGHALLTRPSVPQAPALELLAEGWSPEVRQATSRIRRADTYVDIAGTMDATRHPSASTGARWRVDPKDPWWSGRGTGPAPAWNRRVLPAMVLEGP